MKLAVVIPAYNEEKTVGDVIRGVPRKIAGIDRVEVIVVDDGSTDATYSEASKAGADRIIKHKINKGLSVSFRDLLYAALEDGADVIVNIDADMQHNPADIPRVVKPVLEGRADIVLTYRDIWELPHMSVGKKIGNELATRVVRFLSGLPIKDAQSGFRAYSREAAMQLNILSGYTYVHDTIIQAASKRLVIEQIPCKINERKEGESRLIENVFVYAMRAGSEIIRTYTVYRPLRFFLSLGAIVLLIGFVSGIRVLLHFIDTGTVDVYLPSTILTAILVIVGFQLIILGLIGNAVNANMRVNEESLYNLRKTKFGE